MHVMEDVEEGCNASGALPSSPGHAEQRSVTAKDSAPETSNTPSNPQSPVTNGLLSDHQSDTEPQSPKSEKEEKPERIKRKNSSSQEEELKENEDSNSNDSDTNKRKIELMDDEESPAKKLRTQIQQSYVTHDKMLSEYLESTGCTTIEDFQSQSEQLLAEIRTLNEIAREKEREWNNILHVKKIKEELLIRLQRKRQILLLNAEKIEEFDLSNENHDFEGKKDSKINNSGLMMVPIVSSSPANLNNKNKHNQNNQKHRHILPKPNLSVDAQNEYKTGRQGPILDVRSIIADYRQRHPETVPRRGRRLRSVLNNNFVDSMVTTSGKQGIMNLTSVGLGSGAQVRHGDVSSELGLLLSTMDAASKQDSRPSSADSSSIMNESSMSFKDVLVQFAKLSQSQRQELQAAAAASITENTSKPPYPEVTLHAVTTNTNTNTATHNTNASLLHGILTKSQTKTNTESSKPTTFSPTLARLLTAPERTNTNAQAVYNAAAAALNSGVSISDILTTPKSRNEITITPIGQFGSNSKKEADNIVEEEAEDSADRLVIDEGGQDASENRQRDTGSDAGDDVPQCQGCNQKSAQFVCAGCGNQWYCSRDCQVAAWDEHSEVCSG